MRTFFNISAITGIVLIMSALYILWWVLLREFIYFLYKERYKQNINRWQRKRLKEQIERMAWYVAHKKARHRIEQFYMFRFYHELIEGLKHWRRLFIKLIYVFV